MCWWILKLNASDLRLSFYDSIGAHFLGNFKYSIWQQIQVYAAIAIGYSWKSKVIWQGNCAR